MFLLLILILLLSLQFSFCPDDGHISFSSSLFQKYIFITRLLITRRRYFMQHCLIMYPLSNPSHCINSSLFLILFDPLLLMSTKFFPKFKTFNQKGRDPRDLASVTSSNIWVFYSLFSVNAATLPCESLRWDSYCRILTFRDAVYSLLWSVQTFK